MEENVGFRLRLEVRTGRAFNSDEASFNISLAGRTVTISPYMNKQFSETDRIILEARGFAEEAEAREFGEKLRTTVQIAGLCSHLGVGAGPGENLGGFDPEATDTRGLSILPDRSGVIFAVGEATVTVRADPNQFLGAMDDLADQPSVAGSEIGIPVGLLNLALMNSEPLAKILLAFSAVETAARGPSWSDDQKFMIEKLAQELEASAGGNEDRLQIAEAIRRLYPNSLRQGFRQFFNANGVQDLWSEWDKLYDRRSALFHGREQFSKQEIFGLAAEAEKLCSRIILAIVRRKGIVLPAIANLHYGEF